MLICDKENHPSIIYRRNKIEEIQTHGVYPGAEYDPQQKKDLLEKEIDRILPLVDFKGMLNSMGIMTSSGPSGYHQVTLRALEQGLLSFAN